MAHATESLERAEHTGHAGGGHGHGANDGNPLPMRVGITMAILGVLLAFAAARVGYERTELVQYLVEQQHAHAKYQAQDIKHRSAVLSLRQLHATSEGTKVNGADMAIIAKSVNRYFAESQAAKTWLDAYDPIVAAHSEAQEEYEHAQLAAELGVVLASIALLLRRREPWFLALLLGIATVVLMAMTYMHTSHELHGTEAKLDETEKAYRTLREAGKSTDADQALVDDILKTYGEAH
jgi:hypothetical protein